MIFDDLDTHGRTDAFFPPIQIHAAARFFLLKMLHFSTTSRYSHPDQDALFAPEVPRISLAEADKLFFSGRAFNLSVPGSVHALYAAARITHEWT